MINRCCYHGCSSCFEPQDALPTGLTNEQQLVLTKSREKEILDMGLDLMSLNTCEIEQQLRNDFEMRAFFANLPEQGPIALRDAYFGG